MAVGISWCVQRMTKLRNEKEAELFSELQTQQERMRQLLTEQQQQELSDEDQRIAKAVAEQEAKREASPNNFPCLTYPKTVTQNWTIFTYPPFPSTTFLSPTFSVHRVKSMKRRGGFRSAQSRSSGTTGT